MAEYTTTFKGRDAYREQFAPYEDWLTLFEQQPHLTHSMGAGPVNSFTLISGYAYTARPVGWVHVLPTYAASLSKASAPGDISGQAANQFYIRVDSGPRRLVTVTGLAGLNTPAKVAEGLQTAIRAAGAECVSLVVEAHTSTTRYGTPFGNHTYGVYGSTTATRSRVGITSVTDPSKDLAAYLGLGIANGGLEVWGEDVWPVDSTVELHFDVFGNGPDDPIPPFRFWWAQCYRDPDPEYSGIPYGDLIAPMTGEIELGAIDSWGTTGESTHYMVEVPVSPSVWAPKYYSAAESAELGYAIKLEDEQEAPTHFCWTRLYPPDNYPEPRGVWNNTTAYITGIYFRIHYQTHPPGTERTVTPLIPGPPQSRGGKRGAAHRTRL